MTKLFFRSLHLISYQCACSRWIIYGYGFKGPALIGFGVTVLSLGVCAKYAVNMMGRTDEKVS